MHISIVTGAQNGHVSRLKESVFFAKKKFVLKLLLDDEGHFYVDCLFYVLTIYPKCHTFQFFSCGIRLYIPILTGVQNGRISRLKDSVFLLKNVFFQASFL